MMPSIDDAHVRGWVDAYLAAWTSNDPADIETLFTPDATYRHRPYRAPIAGRAAIVDDWLEHKDEPGSWRARFEPLVVHDGTAVVTGSVDYATGERYSNLWVIRFADDGRCADYTEWWMEHPADSGS
jgi:ketosteroid isomerase-like protein